MLLGKLTTIISSHTYVLICDDHEENHPRHSLVKFLKTEGKENIAKAAGGKEKCHIQHSRTDLTCHGSQKTGWCGIFKALKEKKITQNSLSS